MLDRRPAASRRVRRTQRHLLPGDAQVFAFERASIRYRDFAHGRHVFADPVAAFRNIGVALKPAVASFRFWARSLKSALAISYDIRAPPFGPPALRPITYPAHSPSGPDYIREVLGAAGVADIEVERAHPRSSAAAPRRGAAGPMMGPTGKTDRSEKPPTRPGI